MSGGTPTRRDSTVVSRNTWRAPHRSRFKFAKLTARECPRVLCDERLNDRSSLVDEREVNRANRQDSIRGSGSVARVSAVGDGSRALNNWRVKRSVNRVSFAERSLAFARNSAIRRVAPETAYLAASARIHPPSPPAPPLLLFAFG